MFHNAEVDKSNLKSFSGDFLETLSNCLYCLLMFFKHGKLQFYSMLEFFLDNKSLSEKLIILLSANSYYKEIVSPAFKILIKFCQRMRNRLTQESPDTVVLKYECMIGLKSLEHTQFPIEFDGYNLCSQTR